MEVDPIEDAAHPTGTHGSPGAADKRGVGDTSSGEEEIIDGRNPTQRKIEEERQPRIKEELQSSLSSGRLAPGEPGTVVRGSDR